MKYRWGKVYCILSRPVCQTLSNAWLISKNTAEQYFWSSNALSMVSVSRWHWWIVECFFRNPNWCDAIHGFNTFDLKLRKKLVKCYICSIALHGAETWTLRAVDRKHVEGFEMWCWRRIQKINWTDRVRNEEVLLGVNEQRNILHEISKRRLTGLVTLWVETAFYNGLLKER